MATVTGSLQDIVGADMSDQVGAVIFTLNAPAIQAGSTTPGTIHPTDPKRVTPAASGSFSVNLVATTVMLTDAWYTLTIVWNDSGGPLMDFPDWQIRVPTAGGILSDLITIGPRGGGSAGPQLNLTTVLMGLTQPPNLAAGQFWWKTDPNDPQGPGNTGLIYQGV